MTILESLLVLIGFNWQKLSSNVKKKKVNIARARAVPETFVPRDVT